MLLTILFFTFLGSVLSLIGGLLLLLSKKLILKASHLLISFAAGTLLGTVFFHLLPEAVEEHDPSEVFLFTLIGILVFFLIERFIHWFHSHSHRELTEEMDHADAAAPLIIIGDSVHNFIDGVIIAATFLISFPLGVITALAVIAHEIPQEIGDFAILLRKGISRGKVLLINFLSSLSAVVGALLTFYLKDTIHGYLPIFISLTAGFFIYIASSDLIPEIHHEKRKGFAIYETILLLAGATLMFFLVGSMGHDHHAHPEPSSKEIIQHEQAIDEDAHDHEHEEEELHDHDHY